MYTRKQEFINNHKKLLLRNKKMLIKINTGTVDAFFIFICANKEETQISLFNKYYSHTSYAEDKYLI